MKRWMALAVAGVAAVGVFAQKPATQPAPKPWANKLFLPNVQQDPAQEPPAAIDHDFGTVPFGTLATHTFTVTNIYDVPLQVIDIRAECACLKAYPPNRVLQPNEQAEFTVSMNAGAFKGANTKKLLVTFGPRHFSTAELRFTAVSREDVTVSPGQVDFGIVQQGAKATKTVTLKYTGKERNWKVTDYVASGAACDVEVKETARGFLSVDYAVVVTLKDTAPAGPLLHTVTLNTTDPATPVVTVGIGGTVLPPVSAGTAEFRGVKAGQLAETNVIVKARANCTIAPVADDGDGVSVDTFPISAQVHVVKVKYEPKTTAAPFRKEVRLKTSLPDNPEAVLVVEVK